MPVRETDGITPAPDAAPPEEPDPQPSPNRIVPLPPLTAMDRLAASPAPLPSRTALIGAWVVTFALLAGAVAATIVWRDEVMRAWPPSRWILEPIGHTPSSPAQTDGKKAE
jgi:hypothetical protein